MSKEKVEIELSANSAKLKSEFDAARARVERFRKGVKDAVMSVGGLAVGILGLRAGSAIFGEIADKFDRIGKLGQRFEMPVEEVQRLGVAAELSGTNLEKLVSSLTRGKIAGVDAANGLAAQSAAFRALGIEVERFNSASPSEQIAMLADAYNAAADKAAALHAGTKIMGRGFSELIPLLKAGGEGLREMTAGLETLNQTDVDAIQKFNDDLTLLKVNLQAQIAKQFAGEMQNLEPQIRAIGEALANTTSFLIEHHRGITALVSAVGIYKGMKFSVEMGKTVAVLLRAGVALVANKAATDSETAAVMRNTAAHTANATARATAALAGGAGKGGIAGQAAKQLAASGGTLAGAKILGARIGAAIAAEAGAKAALKIPHVLAAAAAAYGGWQIGTKLLGGNALADGVADRFNKGFDAANEPLAVMLAQMHALVTTARTAEETTRARARITEEINRLEAMNSSLGAGQKKDAVEGAIAALKIRKELAESYRVRNEQRAAERDIAVQMQNQAYWAEMNEKGLAAAAARAEAMKKAMEGAAAASAAAIAGFKSEIWKSQIDMLPGAKQVEIFTRQLKAGLREGINEFNLTSRFAGKEGNVGANDASLKGLYALAQRAESEGQLGLAENLYAKVKKLQELEEKIRKGKADANRDIEAGNQKQEEMNQRQREGVEIAIRRKDLEKEMEVLRLKVAGRYVEADRLREEIEIRKEVKALAEDLKITEKEALEIATERAGLLKKTSQFTARKELAEELAVLHLQVSGQLKKAAALQRERQLRREAHEIAEATGISEAEALKIARRREDLKGRAEGMKALGDDEPREAGKKRIRLYSARESLQRRLERDERTGRRTSISGIDMRSTDLGEKLVRERQSAAPMTAVLKGEDAMPAKMDELIALETRLVKCFENIVSV